MANILKRIYRIFNGTDWDIVHFETDSEQVKHDTTTVKAKLDALKSGALATVVNNLTTTTANTVLDGRQGKALNDKITALNSALEVKTELRSEGAYLDVYVAKNSFEAQVRSAAYLKHKITNGTKQQLYDLGITPVYAIHRRYEIAEGNDFIIIIDTDGILYLQPLGKDLNIGDAINFTEKFFIRS